MIRVNITKVIEDRGDGFIRADDGREVLNFIYKLPIKKSFVPLAVTASSRRFNAWT